MTKTDGQQEPRWFDGHYGPWRHGQHYAEQVHAKAKDINALESQLAEKDAELQKYKPPLKDLVEAWDEREHRLRMEIARLKATVQRQSVWAQVGMHGKAEDDAENADKLVRINEEVGRLEAQAARGTLADRVAPHVERLVENLDYEYELEAWLQDYRGLATPDAKESSNAS